MAMDTAIVFSCDQRYFPLAKGLVLSICEAGLGEGIGLGFIDIGCDEPSLEWLTWWGVRVRTPDTAVMGELADARLGYRRAQVCRPLLPGLFPDVEVLIWIDCDAWVQDPSIFSLLRRSVKESPNKLFVAPECHYTYSYVNDRSRERKQEVLSYYEPTFGREIAAQMSERPTLNSGFFAMSASNPLWKAWAGEVTRLFLSDGSTRYAPMVLHMAEQSALNVVSSRQCQIELIDPLYNYMCLWCLPFRDDEGIVRIALPPHLPLGIVHLAGGWRWYGARYQERGLLYRAGRYLTEADKLALLDLEGGGAVR